MPEKSRQLETYLRKKYYRNINDSSDSEFPLWTKIVIGLFLLIGAHFVLFGIHDKDSEFSSQVREQYVPAISEEVQLEGAWVGPSAGIGSIEIEDGVMVENYVLGGQDVSDIRDVNGSEIRITDRSDGAKYKIEYRIDGNELILRYNPNRVGRFRKLN